MDKKINYSAVVLDDTSRTRLLTNVVVPDGWKAIAHHCTICLSALPADWKSRIGESVNLTITQLGVDAENKAIAVKVDDFERIIPGTPHITVCINESNGAKPKDSNNINIWKPLGKTLILTGTIQEIG